MSNYQDFIRDWKTWNPRRMEDALRRPIVCHHRKCSHRFNPIDTIKMSGPGVPCPQCKRSVVSHLFLKWRGDGMVCKSCGGETQTKFVTIRQNIGMLVVRRFGDVAGHMCKRCIRKHFWPMTATTVGVGWIGVQSIIVAPFYVIGNLGAYAKSIGMKRPREVRRPNMSGESLAKLAPHADEIFNRLAADEPRRAIADDISRQSGASPFETMAFTEVMLLKHLTEVVERHRAGA